MITVHGRATSSNVQMVMWALAEIGLTTSGSMSAALSAAPTTPRVPRHEPQRAGAGRSRSTGSCCGRARRSCAISAPPMAASSSGRANPASRAPVDKWAEWIKTSFGPALLTGVFWPLIGVPESQARRDGSSPPASRSSRRSPPCSTSASRTGRYLGGDDICFADIIVGTLLYRYFTLDFDRRRDAAPARLLRPADGARPAYAAQCHDLLRQPEGKMIPSLDHLRAPMPSPRRRRRSRRCSNRQPSPARPARRASSSSRNPCSGPAPSRSAAPTGG